MCQLYEACHNQEKPIVMISKILDIITYKELEVVCGILPPIPVNSCGYYRLEKDSLEDVKKYMMLSGFPTGVKNMVGGLFKI